MGAPILYLFISVSSSVSKYVCLSLSLSIYLSIIYFSIICVFSKSEGLDYYERINDGVHGGHSGLKILHCHCCGLGHCCGTGSIPGLGTSACHRHGQKKKKKMKEKNKGKELIIRQATLVLLLVFKYYSATRAPFENIYLCSVTVFKLSESWS